MGAGPHPRRRQDLQGQSGAAPEAVDLLAKVRANRYYVASVAAPLAPVTFVHKIKVPVYLACQWTDEQTGGHCPTLAEQFTGSRSRAARPATNFTGDTSAGADGLWTATPPYAWTQNPPGTALAYLTAPLTTNTTVVGPGALHGWIRSSARSVDLQVTVSEVRPDGQETFVQSGWLRTSERKLDSAKSTLLAPVPTLRRSDAAPLPNGRWAKVAVPLYYQGHVYRTGSRIRVTIAAPGGDQPVWAFGEASPRGRASVSLARSRSMPSRLVLPVVDGIDVPTGLPPCPGLRGEPCRPYQPLADQAAGR